MRKFIISTETTSDLPDSYLKEHNIICLPLFYLFGDVTYGGEKKISNKEFFKMMRDGQVATTAASNPDMVKEAFEKAVKEGYDILHIGFSSGLSVSYNVADLMAKEVMDAHPEAKIIVIDSLCASLGQGLLVNSAVEMLEAGKTLDETAQWIEDHKMHLCHQFTVEDLKYLQRGGRISKTVAVLGTLINVKPVLHVDDNGKLVPLFNVRGRKKSLNALVDNMLKAIDGYDNPVVYITHGDSPEDAQYVADLIKEKTGIQNFLINELCPTIGAHSGPGTIALFYYGSER